MVEKYRINAIIKMKIKFYRKSNDRSPVIDFLEKLPVEENARIVACLRSIEELEFDSPRVGFRQIKGQLWEIKIRTHKSGYRIFYVCIQHANIVLLDIYKKQTQKAPKRIIKIAEKRMLEVLNNESTYLN